MPWIDDFPSPRRLMLMAVVCEGGLGLIAVALGCCFNSPPAELIRWQAVPLLWGSLAAVPMLLSFWLAIRYPVGPLEPIGRIVGEMFIPLFRGCSVAELAVIAALAGVGEEMLFRGLIQVVVTEWAGGSWGIWLGLAIASVLFGMAHPMTPAYVVLGALMGLYLGWLWIWTQNLLVPITTHAAYDFVAFVYIAKVLGRRC